MSWLGGFVTAGALLLAGLASDVSSGGTQATGLVHLADLTIPEWDSLGPYAWSPDGTEIVYGGQGNGEVAIVNVSTGATTTAPVKLGPLRAVAWSPDGTQIAVSSLQTLAVFRATDLSVLQQIDWQGLPGGPFGWSLAFSPNGTHILATSEQPYNHGDVWVYSIDPVQQSSIPALVSPYGTRRLAPGGGIRNAFATIGGTVYLVAWVSRWDDGKLPPGATNPGRVSRPSTCLIYTFDQSGPTLKAKFDAPPPEESDPFDGTKDIDGCGYSPSLGRFVVGQTIPPYELSANGVITFSPRNGLSLSVAQGTGEVSPKFGPFDSSKRGDLYVDSFAVSPTDPIAAAKIAGANSQSLVLWDFVSGELKSEVALPSYIGEIRFSPDGRKLAVASVGMFRVYSVSVK